ncbi:MAG: LysM peptidoglycan-binding domain-containing protein [Verrucomicrobia bacterium]|jgi:LysM repeat protein|nr:LysM peptidoglycan-binding domain-containing protein [Verrucomicrobiota bacterium]
MDGFDDELEGDSGAGPVTGKSLLVAVLLAVVGIAVGITGIVMANQAERNVRQLEQRLAEAPDKTPQLEAAVEDLNGRLEKLGEEFVKLRHTDQQLQKRTREGFDAVMEDVRSNRSGINELTQRVGELAERIAKRPAPAPAPSVVTDEEPLDPPAEAVDGEAEEAGEERTVAEKGVHRIEPGDTFSKIAREYGVGLSELLNANPTVNPRALQVGQRIVIPQD